jgi:hypothetical protein
LGEPATETLTVPEKPAEVDTKTLTVPVPPAGKLKEVGSEATAKSVVIVTVTVTV